MICTDDGFVVPQKQILLHGWHETMCIGHKTGCWSVAPDMSYTQSLKGLGFRVWGLGYPKDLNPSPTTITPKPLTLNPKSYYRGQILLIVYGGPNQNQKHADATPEDLRV